MAPVMFFEFTEIFTTQQYTVVMAMGHDPFEAISPYT